jgi:hypothetical protein
LLIELSERQILRWRLACGKFFRDALGANSCGREGCKTGLKEMNKDAL